MTDRPIETAFLMAEIARDNGIERNTCPDLWQDTAEMLTGLTMESKPASRLRDARTGRRT